MSNEERSQIVKERWHTIGDRCKAIYVALARLEEENMRWIAVKSFYTERYETARIHADMKPDSMPLWRQSQSSFVDESQDEFCSSKLKSHSQREEYSMVGLQGTSSTQSAFDEDEERSSRRSLAEKVASSVLVDDELQNVEPK